MAKTVMIDKNIPLPDRPDGPNFYPWEDMAPGDSFFVPGAGRGKTDRRDGITRQINTGGAKKRYPGTLWVQRAVTENGVNGTRVWRLK